MEDLRKVWATLGRIALPDAVKRDTLSRYARPDQALDVILDAAQAKGFRIDQLINEKLIEQDLRWSEESSREIIGLTDAGYPHLLREIASPPTVLYCDGRISLLHERSVAIVGSRKPTHAGVKIAATMAGDIARAGTVVVSGLAHGIDSAAHRGALVADGWTIAVFATGLDSIYPKRNRDLGLQIKEKGLVISEFPTGVGVRRHHFPQRNRIISGLSMGTVVVEATARSGSLITAGFAADQGREVFAVPGSVYSPPSNGPHQLIRDGACLVESGAQVLEGLGWLNPERKKNNAPSEQPEWCREILRAVDFTPTALDQIAERCGLTIGEVSAILIRMECEQLVSACHGGYVRAG